MFFIFLRFSVLYLLEIEDTVPLKNLFYPDGICLPDGLMNIGQGLSESLIKYYTYSSFFASATAAPDDPSHEG